MKTVQLLLLFGLTLSFRHAQGQSQTLFSSQKPSHDWVWGPRDYGGDSALEKITLASLASNGEHTALYHPAFPSHRVRVKKTEFCDPTVNVYTGYVDVAQGSKHFFFSFFESRRAPSTDDIMLYVSGGPGCTSSLNLFMDVGPCRFDTEGTSPNGTVWNEHGWNGEVNVIFLDQPVGVGYSYADYGQTVETTEDSAKDIHAFLSIFFDSFQQFKGRPLHLASMSYGGRYAPVFASEIVDRNRRAAVEGWSVLNLTSVIIGNGVTDITTIYPGRFEIECGQGALDLPLHSIGDCVRMEKALPRCRQAMQESCVDIFDAMDCKAAVAFCDSELSTAYYASGRNFYDVTKSCTGYLCYQLLLDLEEYINNASTRAMLGAELPDDQPVTLCSYKTLNAFESHMDEYASPTQFYVTGLLERGIRVLVYAGTYDWICSWTSNRMWIDRLEWTGQQEYNGQEWRNWTVGASTAGITKSAGPLTFATILEAGHMISDSL